MVVSLAGTGVGATALAASSTGAAGGTGRGADVAGTAGVVGAAIAVGSTGGAGIGSPRGLIAPFFSINRTRCGCTSTTPCSMDGSNTVAYSTSSTNLLDGSSSSVPAESRSKTVSKLPDLDGYEATRLIREPGTPVRNHQVPIVAMTAHAMAGDREKCLASGMNDYLAKPVKGSALREVLEKWLGVQPSVAATTAPSAETPLPRVAAAFDGEDLLERMMGNPELARRVVGRFLSDAPGQLAALAEAVSRSDADAAGLAAHSLKGAAANVGGAQVSATAKRMELLGKSGDLTGVRDLIPELAIRCDDFRAATERFWGAGETGT